MPRALKWTLWTLLALVLLLAVGVFAATRLIDPNDFKPRISELALEQANLELDISGELAWRFWPSLGVSVGRVDSRVAGEQELFAGLESAHVGVAVWPLLFGEVRMDAVRLDGLELNLVQTADGANWERVGPPEGETAGDDKDPTPEDAGESAPMDIPVTVPELAITNSRLNYRDTTTETDILVEHLNLNAQNVSLKEAFPVALSLRYQDQADIRVDLELDTVAALDMDNNRYRLDPMTLTTEIGGITTMPVSITLEQVLEADLDAERLTLENLDISAAGTRTRGRLEITQWSEQPVFAGKLATEPFDANAALEAIGESPIETSDPDALSKVAMEAEFSGPANSILLKPLKVTLDDSTLSGEAGLADLDSAKLVADLTLDSIRLDDYLPPATEADQGAEQPPTQTDQDAEQPPAETDEDAEQPPVDTVGEQTRPLSTEPLLPLDTLRGLLADARLKIGELHYEDITATDMTFAVTAADGVITLAEANGQALDGRFDMSAQLDASGEEPRMRFSQTLEKLQIQPAVQMALEKDLLKGLLSMKAEGTARGNSEKALMESATGTATLDLKDGTLRGVNFHNTLVAGINDMLGAYQALTSYLPTEKGELPRELREDTHIVDLHMENRLEKKVAYVEKLDAELRKGTLSGAGWFNIQSQEFDFSLGMKSPEFSDNKYFAGRTWPLRCAGNLGGEATDWCRPDKGGFRDIGKSVAAQAAKERVKEELGIDAEGDTPQEVIKDAGRKKAEEEVKKKVEEEVQDKLKDLFR